MPHKSPNTRRRSPDAPQKTSNITQKSPDTPQRTSNIPQKSPDTQQQSTNMPQKSPDTRQTSPDTPRITLAAEQEETKRVFTWSCARGTTGRTSTMFRASGLNLRPSRSEDSHSSAARNALYDVTSRSFPAGGGPASNQGVNLKFNRIENFLQFRNMGNGL